MYLLSVCICGCNLGFFLLNFRKVCIYMKLVMLLVLFMNKIDLIGMSLFVLMFKIYN